METNQEQWELWTNRPVIPVPDPTDWDATIPEILPAEYGTCVTTGEPLMVYGTLQHYQNDTYSSLTTITWETVWYGRRWEAEKVWEESVYKFYKIKECVRLLALREKMRALYDKYFYAQNFPITQHEFFNMRFEFPNDIFEQQKNIDLIEQAAVKYEQGL